MEQFVRDARIAQIYEGTNGIQALDLVKRKLIANNGKFMHEFCDLITKFIQQHSADNNLKEFLVALEKAQKSLQDVNTWLLSRAKDHPDDICMAATDYLKLTGLVAFAYMWAQSIAIAYQKLNSTDKNFYQDKIRTGRFFLQRILPQVGYLSEVICLGMIN
jgi:hypothetical protein